MATSEPDCNGRRSIEQMASQLAHELRNPLTSLKIRLFSIQRVVGTDAEVLERFRVVFQEIDRIEGVLRKYLDFPQSSAPILHRPESERDSEAG